MVHIDTPERFAINTLQWVTAREGTAADQSPDGSDAFADPAFIPVYRDFLARAKSAGFSRVMLKVPPTLTVTAYRRMVDGLGLSLAPGYVQLPLPEDCGFATRPAGPAWFRWFDPVRRRAEESLICGLDRVFVASDIQRGGRPRTDVAVGIGHAFDAGRLDRVTQLIGEVAGCLAAEGLRAALHNHVGTWIETAEEVDHVMENVPGLSAGFDIGHLAWAGIDPSAMVSKYADRVADLHVKDLDLEVAAATRATPTADQDASARRLVLEPGLGGIDLTGVLEALPESFAGHVVIEVDRPSMDPDASARQSFAWVESVTGAPPR
jgi:inosose dehydratase